MTSHRISKGIMAWAMIPLLVCNVEAGSLRVIAKYGDPAPGSEGNFGTFLQPAGDDPPNGFVDASTYAPLDRFTVTFDSPNYVYIDEITVQVTGSVAPLVAQTRRRENDGPETVLDRPIPFGETTRFTFNDGVALNVVEYTLAPGDTNGDGHTDLHDVASFQRCMGQNSPTGACRPLDTNQDNTIDLPDYAAFQEFIAGP